MVKIKLRTMDGGLSDMLGLENNVFYDIHVYNETKQS